MNIDEKMSKLNEYNCDRFIEYQEGYYDGKKVGVRLGLNAIRPLLLKYYHELPTTLGYTEQLIDNCIQEVMDNVHNVISWEKT